MNENLFSRKNIVKNELIDMVLETNDEEILKNKDFIKSCIYTVKDLKTFFLGLIFLNKNSYFGRYAFSYNKNIIKSIQKKNKDTFLILFKNPCLDEIYKNKFLDEEYIKNYNKFLNYEILAYNYFFEKRYYNSFIEINLKEFQNYKKTIYEFYKEKTTNNFFSNKDTILVKKGKKEIIYDINEVIIKIFKNIKIEENLDKYIKNNYRKEYDIIFYYLNNFD